MSAVIWSKLELNMSAHPISAQYMFVQVHEMIFKDGILVSS